MEKPKQKRRIETHCRNGHEFTPENVYIRKSGSRRCRTCQKACKRNQYARYKAEDASQWM